MQEPMTEFQPIPDAHFVAGINVHDAKACTYYKENITGGQIDAQSIISKVAHTVVATEQSNPQFKDIENPDKLKDDALALAQKLAPQGQGTEAADAEVGSILMLMEPLAETGSATNLDEIYSTLVKAQLTDSQRIKLNELLIKGHQNRIASNNAVKMSQQVTPQVIAQIDQESAESLLHILDLGVQRDLYTANAEDRK